MLPLNSLIKIVLSWNFILIVLEHPGGSERWIEKRCICSTSTSLNVALFFQENPLWTLWTFTIQECKTSITMIHWAVDSQWQSTELAQRTLAQDPFRFPSLLSKFHQLNWEPPPTSGPDKILTWTPISNKAIAFQVPFPKTLVSLGWNLWPLLFILLKYS